MEKHVDIYMHSLFAQPILFAPWLCAAQRTFGGTLQGVGAKDLKFSIKVLESLGGV